MFARMVDEVRPFSKDEAPTDSEILRYRAWELADLPPGIDHPTVSMMLCHKTTGSCPLRDDTPLDHLDTDEAFWKRR
jgi:hypothetical protein